MTETENQLPTLNELIQHVEAVRPDADPIIRLRIAVAASGDLTDLADHLVGHFVDAARAAGASWAQIGEGLGVSKQAVQQRFVPREPGSVADFDQSFTLAEKNRFRRYTDRAKHCVHSAEDVARASANNEVTSIHLLIGLFAEPDGLAVRAMDALGVAHGNVQLAAVASLSPAGVPTDGPIVFKAEGKKILDLAVREALRFGHNYVGTEHLLLALLADEQSAASGVLVGCGLTYDALSSAFTRLRAEHVGRTRKKG